ncbi:MAG: GxxExxY protein [bacterium]
MIKILHAELSYQITGLCFKAHNELGRFCSEKQYSDKLEKLLNETQVKYQREFELSNLEGNPLKGNRVDFLIENKIILDLKTKKFITKEDYFQMQRYLKAANLDLGLIINFRNTYLKPKRIINNTYL